MKQGESSYMIPGSRSDSFSTSGAYYNIHHLPSPINGDGLPMPEKAVSIILMGNSGYEIPPGLSLCPLAYPCYKSYRRFSRDGTLLISLYNELLHSTNKELSY
ncbi:unnamed protein product [Meloidogyne enterolobii]|uniref:Uncharacterized protein n=2 Tax=Meloidogyne enterolobii TaxID=390850 RepID=A0ACB0XQ94_MELEN|nr:unnamed protein product [Meloidogyne enterolobii]